jgi:hypothetical protein
MCVYVDPPQNVKDITQGPEALGITGRECTDVRNKPATQAKTTTINYKIL